jgi:hypothetical protein
LIGLLAPVPPGLFLAVLLGTLYGALGHLVFGRHWIRLPLYILGGVGGCVLVWLTRIHLIRQLPAPGGLALVEASFVAWLLLCLIAAWRRA